LPPATQTFTYDDDGNQLTDGVWSYTWDAENRLIQMTNLTTIAADARKKLVFTYDFLGRRATKKVYPWSSTNYSTTSQTDLKFLHDGWNLVSEIDSTNGIARSYVWGMDLGGSLQGAGGVGGLLAGKDSTVTYFPAYDGNGNVIALIKTDGTTSGQYEYGPFGENFRVTDTVVANNPFRSATKYTDTESGLNYYGYRYYSSDHGRWLNRDAVEEAASLNLYGFVNNTAQAIDVLGLYALQFEGPGWTEERKRAVTSGFAALKPRLPTILNEVAKAENEVAAYPKDCKLIKDLTDALAFMKSVINKAQAGVDGSSKLPL